MSQEADKPGKGKESGNAREPEEKATYSREEFKDAKSTVNDGKAAEDRLESGNFRNESHKQDLEQRVQKMEELKQEKPELYDRAEKAVEKMGVRDPDTKIEEAARREMEKAAAKAEHEAARAAEWKLSMDTKREQQDAKQAARDVDKGNAKVDDAVKGGIETSAKVVEFIADEAKSQEKMKQEMEKAKAEKNERDTAAVEMRSDGMNIRDSEKVAAELQKVSGGQRQEVEKELKEALDSGKAKDGKEAAELVKQKIEETSGRATVDQQQTEKLERAANKGDGRSSNMNDVYEGAAAKEKLAEKDKEAAQKQHEAESAAMRSIVEKYGSPDQQRAYNNLDKADKDAYKTAEEKEKQAKQEHKEAWGY